MYRRGYDISHWAGEINWMQVAYGKPDFLIFKASDGNFETGRYRENFDSKLIPNWERAHKYVKCPIDVYHWWVPGKNVMWQIDLAKFVMETLDPAPGRMWLDMEEKTSGGGGWASVVAFLQSFPGCGVYTSPGFLGWADSTWGKRPPWLAQYPLWLAQYPYTVDLTKPPKAPPPWPKWDVWQVNKNHKVAGIPGGISLDVME